MIAYFNQNKLFYRPQYGFTKWLLITGATVDLITKMIKY